MIVNFRKNFVVTLALVFAVFSFYCCCVPQAVEAAQVKAPSCHETHDEHKPQEHSGDCCQKLPAVTIEKSLLQTYGVSVLPVVSEFPRPSLIAYASPFSPQIFFDTAPLYIKHEVLRI